MDGQCGPQTWAILVEAGYRLGDRLLYLRRPMLRGDDVAGLQSGLGALGFDAGRVDGIFGAHTARALSEFQRNIAIPVDGICGQTTLDELDRLQAHRGQASLVVGVREREQLRRAPRTLTGRRVAVGQQGGLGATVEAVRRDLAQAGAHAFPLHHPDASHLAAQANGAQVDVYLGLRLDPGSTSCRLAYYSGYRYESAGGRRLAELAMDRLHTVLHLVDCTALGMSIPELRETRMPAVVCEMGPPSLLVERSAELARALIQSLTTWVSTSWD